MFLEKRRIFNGFEGHSPNREQAANTVLSTTGEHNQWQYHKKSGQIEEKGFQWSEISADNEWERKEELNQMLEMEMKKFAKERIYLAQDLQRKNPAVRAVTKKWVEKNKDLIRIRAQKQKIMDQFNTAKTPQQRDNLKKQDKILTDKIIAINKKYVADQDKKYGVQPRKNNPKVLQRTKQNPYPPATVTPHPTFAQKGPDTFDVSPLRSGEKEKFDALLKTQNEAQITAELTNNPRFAMYTMVDGDTNQYSYPEWRQGKTVNYYQKGNDTSVRQSYYQGEGIAAPVSTVAPKKTEVAKLKPLLPVLSISPSPGYNLNTTYTGSENARNYLEDMITQANTEDWNNKNITFSTVHGLNPSKLSKVSLDFFSKGINTLAKEYDIPENAKIQITDITEQGAKYSVNGKRSYSLEFKRTDMTNPL